jgi:hypothetical protein
MPIAGLFVETMVDTNLQVIRVCRNALRLGQLRIWLARS